MKRIDNLRKWYKAKEEWIDVAPFSSVTKLLRRQKKELMRVRFDMRMGEDLELYETHERLAVELISKLEKRIKKGI